MPYYRSSGTLPEPCKTAMKHIRYYTGFLLMLCCFTESRAQEFITKARIEYEKKVNMRRELTKQHMPQDGIDRFPEFQTNYFDLFFIGDQTLYKPGRQNRPPQSGNMIYISISGNEGARFSDFTTGKVTLRRSLMDLDYIFEDSIPPVKWKIEQETRNIAGYECRKAIGRIYDSVYVVAFYSEEFVSRGGPEGIQGLPGLILGMAIPRYNTTWFATKVELAKIDESMIVPPTLKGKKLSREETKAKLLKKMQEMGNKNADAKAMDHYFKAGYFLDY